MGKEDSEIKVTVRGLPPELWQEIRVEAIRQRIPTGQIVADALRDWLQKHQGK